MLQFKLFNFTLKTKLYICVHICWLVEKRSFQNKKCDFFISILFILHFYSSNITQDILLLSIYKNYFWTNYKIKIMPGFIIREIKLYVIFLSFQFFLLVQPVQCDKIPFRKQGFHQKNYLSLEIFPKLLSKTIDNVIIEKKK